MKKQAEWDSTSKLEKTGTKCPYNRVGENPYAMLDMSTMRVVDIGIRHSQVMTSSILVPDRIIFHREYDEDIVSIACDT